MAELDVLVSDVRKKIGLGPFSNLEEITEIFGQIKSMNNDESQELLKGLAYNFIESVIDEQVKKTKSDKYYELTVHSAFEKIQKLSKGYCVETEVNALLAEGVEEIAKSVIDEQVNYAKSNQYLYSDINRTFGKMLVLSSKYGGEEKVKTILANGFGDIATDGVKKEIRKAKEGEYSPAKVSSYFESIKKFGETNDFRVLPILDKGGEFISNTVSYYLSEPKNNLKINAKNFYKIVRSIEGFKENYNSNIDEIHTRIINKRIRLLKELTENIDNVADKYYNGEKKTLMDELPTEFKKGPKSYQNTLNRFGQNNGLSIKSIKNHIQKLEAYKIK